MKAQQEAEQCERAASEEESEAEAGAVHKMRKEGLKEALLKFAELEKLGI